MIEVIKLEDKHLPLLEQFCNSCNELGYNNNASINAMKFGQEYDLGELATFFAVVVNGEIAAVSGSHSLGPKELRCGFRGCALPKYRNVIKGLSKTHMNNLTWGPLVSEEILDGLERGYESFYITTSHTSHNPSGRMHRTHRVLELLAKQGIVEHMGIETFYHIPQTKWKFNLTNFFKSTESFELLRKELNIIPYKYSLQNPIIEKYVKCF